VVRTEIRLTLLEKERRKKLEKRESVAMSVEKPGRGPNQLRVQGLMGKRKPGGRVVGDERVKMTGGQCHLDTPRKRDEGNEKNAGRRR